jgi:hypothetical protein
MHGAGDKTKMTEPSTHLTQHEADCLADASEGRRVAPTSDSTRVMSVDESGAVLHHEEDVERLRGSGWLAEEGGQFVVTPAGRAAMSLPVQE